MRAQIASLVALVGFLMAGQGFAAEHAKKVYFIEPVDGATVSSPFAVKFGLVGMGVAPAGIELANTGHHHLLVNVDTLPVGPIPADENHLHFGKGQTETLLELSPGTHTLQLMVGNYLHRPLEPNVVSEKITITVLAQEEK